jgi:hypothetical protein
LAPGGGPRYAWYEGRENKDGAKMKDTAQHLRTLEEIERDCIPGLVNVLREEGLEAVRYILWDMTGGTAITIPASGATEEQERIGWEKWVRMDRIMGAVLRDAHEPQVEEKMDALEDGPGRFYESHLEDD